MGWQAGMLAVQSAASTELERFHMSVDLFENADSQS
jgi:hypothetical protein